VSIIHVFKKIWHLSLSSFLVLFITFSLYPGITTMMKTNSTDPKMEQWFSTILLAIFMVADFLGRLLSR